MLDQITVRRRKDGSLVDVSLTVSPIKDAQGRVIGASKIARDITERRRVEATLRQNERLFSTLVEQAQPRQRLLSARISGRRA